MWWERAERSAQAALVIVGCAMASACHSGPHPATAVRRPTAEEHGQSATAADWETTPPNRVEELFIGRFPGVRVLVAPGGLFIRVRGDNSINGDNAPLYVVDGIAYETSNGLVSINPSDIAKIQVLKDIGDTAFYGVRGANGVILITTKHAK